MIITMLGVFLVHVLLGLPLFISLLVTALVTLYVYQPLHDSTYDAAAVFWWHQRFLLMAIRYSSWRVDLMNASGLTERLMGLARLLVGHLRGGMGHVNVVSSVFFAGVNGSAVADTSALGSFWSGHGERRPFTGVCSRFDSRQLS